MFHRSLLALAFLFWAVPAIAQNVTCPTRPPGDSSNACASTAFVQNAVGTAAIPGGTNGQIQYNNNGAFGGLNRSGTGAIIATTTGTLTSGHCVQIDASGNFIDAGAACGTGGGGGGVTSLNSLTGGLNITGVNGITITPSGVNVGLALPAITQAATSQFYQGSGAHIQRLNDRVFIANATANNGNNTNPNSDWWSSLGYGLCGCDYDSNFAQVLIEYDINSPNATAAVPQPALAAAVQCGQCVAGATPRAGEFFAYNNPATAGNNPAVWALYLEGHYIFGTANETFTIENEARAWNAVSTAWTPYSTPGPATINNAFGCGAGLGPTHNCTVAEYITANPQQFGTGIVFLAGSLCACATGGTTIGAIEMPSSYMIQWYLHGTTIGASITMDGSGNIQLQTYAGGNIYANGKQLN